MATDAGEPAWLSAAESRAPHWPGAGALSKGEHPDLRQVEVEPVLDPRRDQVHDQVAADRRRGGRADPAGTFAGRSRARAPQPLGIRDGQRVRDGVDAPIDRQRADHELEHPCSRTLPEELGRTALGGSRCGGCHQRAVFYDPGRATWERRPAPQRVRSGQATRRDEPRRGEPGQSTAQEMSSRAAAISTGSRTSSTDRAPRSWAAVRAPRITELTPGRPGHLPPRGVGQPDIADPASGHDMLHGRECLRQSDSPDAVHVPQVQVVGPEIAEGRWACPSPYHGAVSTVVPPASR